MDTAVSTCLNATQDNGLGSNGNSHSSALRVSADSDCREFLTGLLDAPPLFDEPLANHTTMRVGGPASAFVTISNVIELQRLMEYIHQHRVRHYLLGNGSNIVFTARGFRGMVLQLGRPFEYCEISGRNVVAGGALLLSALARQTAAKGLTGLEFGCGIPGTVGGSLAGNAGAGPESIADHVTFVDLLDWNGEIRRFCKDELSFSYRKSNLPEKGQMVLAARFSLAVAPANVPKEKITWLCNYRSTTQPLRFPSAGCIFKNPKTRTDDGKQEGEPLPSAGALIDRAGLKGLRVGDAEVSALHANFIINRGKATSDEVMELIDQIRARVTAAFDVDLELEVRVVES